MKGVIVNFRGSNHRKRGNQMVVKVDGVDSKDKAEALKGKSVVFNTGKKDLKGKISSVHGNSGAVRVLFETGMPGQAIGQNVKIE